MSDVVATMWSLAAILFALRSRRREGWAAAAGAALGMAVLVRPPAALLLVPLLFAIRLRLRTVLWLLLGGAPFAAVFLGWNQVAFGNPFRTGYSELGGFSMSYFPERFRHYGGWLSRLMSPLVLAGWALVSLDRRVALRDRWHLLLWFGSFFLFYCYWSSYEAWWYTRFLLPAVPALILGSLLVARDGIAPQLGGRRAPLRRALAALALAIVFAFEYSWIRDLNVLRLVEGDRLYPDACRWAEAKVPPNSLVISMQTSGALKYYTNLTPVRWDWIEPGQVLLLRERARAEGYQWFALLFPFEEEEVRKRLPWGWTKVGNLREATLWRLDQITDNRSGSGSLPGAGSFVITLRRGAAVQPVSAARRSPHVAWCPWVRRCALPRIWRAERPAHRGEAVCGIDADRRAFPVDARARRCWAGSGNDPIRVPEPRDGVAAILPASSPAL